MTTWASPAAVAFRNTVLRLTGRLAPGSRAPQSRPHLRLAAPGAARPGDAG